MAVRQGVLQVVAAGPGIDAASMHIALDEAGLIVPAQLSEVPGGSRDLPAGAAP